MRHDPSIPPMHSKDCRRLNAVLTGQGSFSYDRDRCARCRAIWEQAFSPASKRPNNEPFFERRYDADPITDAVRNADWERYVRRITGVFSMMRRYNAEIVVQPGDERANVFDPQRTFSAQAMDKLQTEFGLFVAECITEAWQANQAAPVKMRVRIVLDLE